VTAAKGTFKANLVPGETLDDRNGVQLGLAHVSKTFAGDLVGTSETSVMTVMTPQPAAYVGIERFDGSLHGRNGTFVLQHNAGVVAGEQWMTWKIVETSGTGELAGIRGEGQIIIDPDGSHSYELEYDI
jgi:hypothetical protein